MLIVLIGGSGVGKTTIQKQLDERGIESITVYTTRELRDDDFAYAQISSTIDGYKCGESRVENDHDLRLIDIALSDDGLTDMFHIHAINGHDYFIPIEENKDVKVISIIDVNQARAYLSKHKQLYPKEPVLKYEICFNGDKPIRDKQEDRDTLKHSGEEFVKVDRDLAISTILKDISEQLVL